MDDGGTADTESSARLIDRRRAALRKENRVARSDTSSAGLSDFNFQEARIMKVSLFMNASPNLVCQCPPTATTSIAISKYQASPM